MLEIDRLSLQVRAAAAPERAERLAGRLRDAAVRGIERDRYALSPPGAPAYLFVERLALHCAVSSDWDDEAIGAEVARALAAALERSAGLAETVAFRDRAELLAAFYSALAEGRAWERWWFEEFDGLRALPASAALRTSVINEGPHGVAALARLTEAALAEVVRLLAAGDAARLVDWLAQRPQDPAAALAPLWKASASLPLRGDDNAALLRALVAAERAAPGAAHAGTLGALRAMKALRAAAVRGEIDQVLLVQENPLIFLRTTLTALSMPTHWLERVTESEAALIAKELCARRKFFRPSRRDEFG